ncbi:GNAT family N-acetyltransferase [Candidatus Margulisiibacteriota bacterium]
MDIKVITDEQSFAGLQNTWQNLDNKTNLSPFSEYTWNKLWWQYFKSDKKLYVMVMSENGQTLGIAPFYLNKKKALAFLGTGNSDYLDFIIQPGQEAKFLEALFIFLKNTRKQWDQIELVDIPETSVNYIFIQKLLKSRTLSGKILPTMICPYLKMEGSYQDLLNSRSSNFRYDLKRKLKRASKNGEVSFEIATQLFDLTELIDLYEKRWAKKDTNATIRSKAGQGFLKAAINSWATNNILKVPLLKLGGKVIAFCIGFVKGGRFYYYIPSIDPAYHQLSPGKLLIEKIIQAFPQLQINEIDFMKGEERYKLEWSKTFRKNYRILINNTRLKSRIVAYANYTFYKFRNWARTTKFLRWVRFNLIGFIKNLFKKKKNAEQ